jgi:hypothetical protein
LVYLVTYKSDIERLWATRQSVTPERHVQKKARQPISIPLKSQNGEQWKPLPTRGPEGFIRDCIEEIIDIIQSVSLHDVIGKEIKLDSEQIYNIRLNLQYYSSAYPKHHQLSVQNSAIEALVNLLEYFIHLKEGGIQENRYLGDEIKKLAVSIPVNGLNSNLYSTIGSMLFWAKESIPCYCSVSDKRTNQERVRGWLTSCVALENHGREWGGDSFTFNISNFRDARHGIHPFRFNTQDLIDLQILSPILVQLQDSILNSSGGNDTENMDMRSSVALNELRQITDRLLDNIFAPLVYAIFSDSGIIPFEDKRYSDKGTLEPRGLSQLTNPLNMLHILEQKEYFATCIDQFKAIDPDERNVWNEIEVSPNEDCPADSYEYIYIATAIRAFLWKVNQITECIRGKRPLKDVLLGVECVIPFSQFGWSKAANLVARFSKSDNPHYGLAMASLAVSTAHNSGLILTDVANNPSNAKLALDLTRSRDDERVLFEPGVCSGRVYELIQILARAGHIQLPEEFDRGQITVEKKVKDIGTHAD